MAIAGLLVWGSGAPRRRQRLLDDTGSSQSCPAASEHGSGSVSRFRSTSSSTRWSVFSFRETLSAMSMRWSCTARELSALLRRRRRQCFSVTLAHREARLRPASCRLAVCVVRCPQLQSERSKQSRGCLVCRVEGWQVALREWRKFRVPVTLLTVSADAKPRRVAVVGSSMCQSVGEVGQQCVIAPDGQDDLAP